jgi:aspartate/methionine/tyrosine aminotransferase
MRKHFPFDLGFGEPVFARQALSQFYQLDVLNILNCEYPNVYGDEILVSNVKKYVESQTGWKPNYIIITNGATAAIHLMCVYFKSYDPDITLQVNNYHFSYYPKIASASGLKICGDLSISGFIKNDGKNIYLIDSPSNPLGSISYGHGLHGNFYESMWDAAYHNEIYTDKPNLFPKTNVMIGSFSKIFGLAGLRVGFIATDDSNTYLRVHELNDSINCGINLHGQKTLNNIFENVPLDKYYSKARSFLDDNRTEFSKLESTFGNRIPDHGMFYPTFYDKKLYDSLLAAGINVILVKPLNDKTKDGLIRFNMGQDRDLVKQAVSIIKTRI